MKGDVMAPVPVELDRDTTAIQKRIGGHALVTQDQSATTWPTNIPVDSELGRSLMMDAMGDQTVKIEENEGRPFMVSYYAVMPGEKTDEQTGEVKQFIRLVLLDGKGGSMSTTSEVAPLRFRRVIELYGPGPWFPPLPIVLEEKRSRGKGRTFHSLRVLPREGVK